MRVNLLQTLSHNQIEVAADFYYHGLSAQAIADKRGVRRQTVEKLLSKARTHLARLGSPEPQRFKRHCGRERNIPDALMRSL